MKQIERLDAIAVHNVGRAIIAPTYGGSPRPKQAAAYGLGEYRSVERRALDRVCVYWANVTTSRPICFTHEQARGGACPIQDSTPIHCRAGRGIESMEFYFDHEKLEFYQVAIKFVAWSRF